VYGEVGSSRNREATRAEELYAKLHVQEPEPPKISELVMTETPKESSMGDILDIKYVEQAVLDKEMRKVRFTIQDLEQEHRKARENLDDLRIKYETLSKKLEPAMLLGSMRDLYELDCKAKIKTMFDRGLDSTELSDVDDNNFERKREHLNNILMTLKDIHKKLSVSPLIDLDRTKSDIQDLERQIQLYDERSQSLRSRTLTLRMPQEFGDPHFLSWEEFTSSSRGSISSESINGGYIAFLGEEYAQYIEKGRKEIEKQINEMQSASSDSDKSIKEFIRRDLINLIDTVDTIVKKSTGTFRSPIVNDEVVHIFKMLGVTEIEVEVGKEYDAYLHQPIKKERSNLPNNFIIDIQARGILAGNGEILRKTRVTIAE